MKPITVETTINRPVEEVYDHLDVLANHEAFTNHFLVDWRPEGPAAGVGAQVRVKAKPGGQEVLVTVLEATRPTHIAEKTEAAGGKRLTRGTYTLRPLGTDTTHVSFELRIERSPVVERPVAPLIRMMLVKANQTAVDRLKEQLQTARTAA